MPLLPQWPKSLFFPLACSFLLFSLKLLRFLTVLTTLQWDSVFVRRHPLASVLSELSVLHGVWADISAIDARWDAAVQWWRGQRRLPGYKPGGQIRRVQIWLRLWRSSHKVLDRSPLILFCVTFSFLFLWYYLTRCPIPNVMICATGVRSRSVWTHGMSWGCLAQQRVVSCRWTARGQWKELLRYFITCCIKLVCVLFDHKRAEKPFNKPSNRAFAHTSCVCKCSVAECK